MSNKLELRRALDELAAAVAGYREEHRLRPQADVSGEEPPLLWFYPFVNDDEPDVFRFRFEMGR